MHLCLQINVVLLVLVLWSIYKTKRNQTLKPKSIKGEEKGHDLDVAKYVKDNVNYFTMTTMPTKRHILKATVILLPLLGITWVFGLLAVNESTAVFAWLFTIFNSLQVKSSFIAALVHYLCTPTQGLFIFFFHVVRNKTVSVHTSYILLLCGLINFPLYLRYHQGYTRGTLSILQPSPTRYKVFKLNSILNF